MSYAKVQDQSQAFTASTSSLVITPTTAPTAGNLQIIAVCGSSASPTVTSIAQTNCTWAKAQGSQVNSEVEIWWALAGASPGTTITVTMTGNVPNAYQTSYSEYSGAPASSVPNTGNTATGTSATPTTASISPAGANGGLLFACTRKSGTFSSGPTNGWTALTTGSTGTQYAILIVTGAFSGPYSTGWTYGTSTAWDTCIEAFNAAAGGGGGSPVLDRNQPRGLSRGLITC